MIASVETSPKASITEDGVDPSQITDPLILQQALAASLHQAQQSCQTGVWSQVLAQCQAAIEQCHQALKLDPQGAAVREHLAKGHVESARQLQAEGNLPEGVRAYLQALQLHPRLYEAYNRLRYNLMRYEIAPGHPLLLEIATVCQAILAKQPEIIPARVTLAYALTRLGDLSEAAVQYRAASERVGLKHPPNNPPAQPDRRRGPDFFIIGAEKCGTTSLYHYLRRHPAILPPVEKEIDFFDLEYAHGLDWYLAHFPPLPSQPGWLTGETSANYFYSAEAPRRIFEQFPQAQLILMVRHPVERTMSRYAMMVRNGSEKRSFETVVTEEIKRIQAVMTADDIPWPVLNRSRHVGNSLYYYHLKRWLEVFPREQLLVLSSEALFNQPEATMQQLYGTLGLAPHSEETYKKHNEGSYAPITGEICDTLADFFGPHTRKFEALVGQSFGW